MTYHGHQFISFIAYTNGTTLSVSCFWEQNLEIGQVIRCDPHWTFGHCCRFLIQFKMCCRGNGTFSIFNKDFRINLCFLTKIIKVCRSKMTKLPYSIAWFLRFATDKENLTVLLNLRSLSFIANRSLFFITQYWFMLWIDPRLAIDPLAPQGEFCTLWFLETAIYKSQNKTC